MSEKIIKCAKCQNNAETEPRWDEFTETYPIRDKDEQIYCWDCYKGFSCCQVCQKSVANLRFPKSGNPCYLHAGGYSLNCERIRNEVNFICSEKCGKKLVAKRIQDWKDKLSQGWTKCEECVKFWTEEWVNETGCEWMKEEKHQWKFIKLAQPGQGKLCSEHKNWEEGGKQEYERKNIEYQKRWEALSNEEKLSEVKKEYRHGENITEIAARSEIPPMVLHKWQTKDSHRQHNCPDCQLDHEPTGNDNNFSISANENNSLASADNESKKEKLVKELTEAKRQGKSQEEIERLKSELQKLNNQQKEGVKPAKNNNGLVLGVVMTFFVSILFLGVILINKNNKKKK